MAEKYYTVCTFTPEQWTELHAELIADGNVYDTVPSREVDVDNPKLHSETKGSYLLTEEEFLALREDERVRCIDLSAERYPEETFLETQPYGIDNDAYNRYGNDRNHNWQRWYGWWENDGLTDQFRNIEPDVNRVTRLYRITQGRQNPWLTANRWQQSVITDHIRQVGAGEDVDIVIVDDGVWIGHTEFISSGVVGAVNPVDYKGGNVLPGDGYCEVLDMLLDAPYYIDPDWFNADANNRLETRWDGTTVPVETEAINWWRNGNNRSEGFDFGNILVPTNYRRLLAHGSNEQYPGTLVLDAEGDIVSESVIGGKHGTQCGSQAYGRTQGMAYNANKWQLSKRFSNGDSSYLNDEVLFDIQKVFHRHKPDNPVYGTKDPTISSNSWGLFPVIDGNATHHYWRGDPVADYDPSDRPNYIRQNPWVFEVLDNGTTIAGDEMVAEGVIFVTSAGNNSQQMVNPDHPNYDNRIASNNTDALYDDRGFDFNTYWRYTGTTNRRGYPNQVGKSVTQSFQGDTGIDFPTINVGAIDDHLNSGRETKVGYSSTGPAVDVFQWGNNSQAAILGQRVFGNSARAQRVDNSYPDLGTHVSPCIDGLFGGTSSACPGAVGMMGLVMQYNRGWTWVELKDWLHNTLELQEPGDLYRGPTEPTTPDSGTWSDNNALFGAEPRIMYQAPIPVSTRHPDSNIPPPDTVPPVVTLIGSNPINHERFTPFTDPGATATDARDGDLAVTSNSGLNVGVVGTYTITYSATDAAGNTGTATRTVNIVDTTAPVINTSLIASSIGEGDISLGGVSCNESSVTWSISGTDSNLITIQPFGTSDAATLALKSPADFETKTSYSFVISVEDASNNSSTTASVIVSVVNDPSDDPPPPPPPPPAPIITVTGANPVTHERFTTYTDAGATSNGGETISVTGIGLIDVNTVGSYQIGYYATATGPGGDTTGSATRTVNVVDTTAPTIDTSNIVSSIVENGNTTLGLVSSSESAVTWGISGADSNLMTLTVPDPTNSPQLASIDLNAPADFETKTRYSFAITCTDDEGNQSIVSVNVNVTNDTSDDPDITPPVITITGANPLTHERTTAYTDPGATATDDTDGAVTVLSELGSVDVNTVGSYTVTYTATDAAGNSATSARTVNVVDTNAPVINIANVNTTVNEFATALGSVSCNESPVIWGLTGADSSLVTITPADVGSPLAGLALNTAADFETKTSYTFAITCEDAQNNVATSGVTISVVNNLDDDPPPSGTQLYLTKVGRHSFSTENHDPNPIKRGEEKRGSYTPVDDPETPDVNEAEVFDSVSADVYYSDGGHRYVQHGTDIGTNTSSELDTTDTTINIPPAYVYEGDTGFTNINDPLMSYMEFRVYPEGVTSALDTQWAVTSIVGQVLSPEGSNGYTISFSADTDHHRIGITNSKWASLPFDEDYECLMEDFTTQTFETLSEAQSATNPAVLSLLNLDLPEDDSISTRIQFTVTFRKAQSNNYHTVVYTLGQNLYKDIRDYINRVSTLSPPGDGDPDNLPELPDGT